MILCHDTFVSAQAVPLALDLHGTTAEAAEAALRA
jgi:hypothetical protein